MPKVLNLDWGTWFYGLVAGFVGGGAGAVTSGFSNMLVDPEHFNIQHPRLILEQMVAMFLISGILTGLSYLHQNPVPVEVKTTTETTVMQNFPPAIVKTTVETTEAKDPK